jgi:hypothetical protein
MNKYLKYLSLAFCFFIAISVKAQGYYSRGFGNHLRCGDANLNSWVNRCKCKPDG